MAPKARMRQANKLNEAKVTKRGKIPTTLVSFISFRKKFRENWSGQIFVPSAFLRIYKDL